MEIHLNPDVQAALMRIAAERGRDAETLAREAIERFLDAAAHADAREGIRQGLDDLANGLGRPAREVFDEIRADYGIPR